MCRDPMNNAFKAEIIPVHVIAVSFERVSCEYWAHLGNGRFIISREEFEVMSVSIRKIGYYVIPTPPPCDLGLVELMNQLFPD